LIGLGIVVVILILLQVVASPIAKNLLNRKLDNLPGYTGRIDGMSVAFWRAGLEVNDFVLSEIGHEQDPPLLHVKNASFKFAPGSLFSGKLGGTAVIDGVTLIVIKREAAPDLDEAAKKAEQKLQETKQDVQRWQTVLRETFPLTLERLEVKNSHFQFIDRSHQPHVDIGIHDLHIVATDLQNRPEANGEKMPAQVNVTGTMTGDGKLKIALRLDPVARQPHFALNFELREQQLPPLNSFLLAYADADVSRGTFELFSEINAEDGAYDGYVKPLFRDLEFKNVSDEDKNVAERLKETVVSAVASVFENKEQDQVATKAPFAGNFANNDLDIWTTIVNLIHNAFVQALRGGLEGQP
jgi:uncharacterized protein involved in outer membrane biogenesis